MEAIVPVHLRLREQTRLDGPGKAAKGLDLKSSTTFSFGLEDNDLLPYRQ